MSGPPLRAAYLRRQAVAFELGITRHTLARMIERDESFPRFFAISPGIEVIARDDLEAWILQKRNGSRMKRLLAPSSPKDD